ncbi:sulfate ABC transporter substrate-binding protein [Mycolicibacterium chitae]|uniref:Sulfate ABC transporter, periplasmic sulfate-binding protein n=1 Tax=Mycolicibacterium chitae TaxID=1792 RepID=A0A448I4T4_MYCCI|nr:sulfate ABC transporter substrate-binding protein [Mycolicibacterium chitae]MCV7106539.1 sulfate ABC transporter substrate-binding protein [Mycolicibacterium chitae]BBZ03708.1 sulfate ABC transporter substrate-binding protein [Mycolicibacterium chitae]VEG47363.1 sulfate ABC transporter, periplasmic sulfate-binding protein [Mycolicibacterium chitae]
MRNVITSSKRLGALAALALTTTLVAACGGGASDVAGEGAAPDADTTLTLVAYAVPEPGWSKVGPAFAATPEGEGVGVTASYGASGDQSRGVESGKPADLVNFSVEPDITRLVKAGLVDEDWNSSAHKGVPFGSLVTFAVREGNPKNIQTWDDLLRDDIEVITPSPLSSGSAKWNLLAPYAAKSNGGEDHEAGIAFVEELVKEHVKLRPGSGREATDVFRQGTGDVLLAYENEALNFDLEYVNPAQTFKIENPVAVVNTSKHVEKARQFVNFQFTPEAQRVWAEAGFRPVDPAVAEEFAEKFPAPEKLWTIDDLGGWGEVDAKLFDKDHGTITQIYKQATG